MALIISIEIYHCESDLKGTRKGIRGGGGLKVHSNKPYIALSKNKNIPKMKKKAPVHCSTNTAVRTSIKYSTDKPQMVLLSLDTVF